MSSKASVLTRARIATERLETACQALAKSLNSQLPPPPEYTKQPDLAFAQHLERTADVIELISKKGKFAGKGK